MTTLVADQNPAPGAARALTSVLFVDDEPNVLAGLRRMLRTCRDEWKMTFAANAEEALEIVRLDGPDVIVTDMRMPGVDGAELLERVRRTRPETVRIVLSGHSDREMTLRAVGPAHQYLSKPCDAESLRSTIREAVRLQQAIHTDGVRRLVEGVDALPSLPAVYVLLVEELSSPGASVEAAGRLIAQDLAMSAKVLQIVNSSFFGLPVRVTDVPHAVALLGLGVIKPLALSTGVFRQFEGRNLGGLSLGRLVSHSLGVAVAARRVAESLAPSGELADDAFLAGMLHDLGRLLLAQSNPVEHARVVAAARAKGVSTGQLEREAFGATHGELGGYLLGLWGLPTSIVEAVTFHHEPSHSPSNRVSPLAASHAAEALSGEAAWDEQYLERLGLADGPQRWADHAPRPTHRSA